MKTEVIMKRELFGMPISQKSKTEFFSATDLTKAGTKWRRLHDLPDFNLAAWFKTKGVKEFVNELEDEYGKVIIKGRGRLSQTWVHPLLFIDLALAINPKLKIEVYNWLFDHLIRHRNESGNSYKEMCGYLYARHGNKLTFPKMISDLAIKIKYHCKVVDWQEATEDQLKLRDRIHSGIALLANSMNNNEEAIRLTLKHNNPYNADKTKET